MLTPASLTAEVRERIAFDGSVITPIDEAQLRQTVRSLKHKNVTSIAVCFLFSFLAPQHEQAARRIIEEEIQAAASRFQATLSRRSANTIASPRQ